jgi:hypothetical protein
MSKHLGYPLYFTPFLGVLKLLGVIAMLIPGFPRIKEWVYAGFTFDLVGALYSFIAVGDKPKDYALFVIFFALLIVSYIYFHKRLEAKAAGAVK